MYYSYATCNAITKFFYHVLLAFCICILENLKSKTAQSRTEQVSNAKIAVRFPQPPYQQMSSQLIAPTDWIKASKPT